MNNNNENRIDWLDSLRGLACLIVIIAHIISTDDRYGKYASGCGKIGVWLFLIISGFLAVYPLLEKKREFTLKSLPSWYAGKALRLYPAYILAVLLALCTGFLPSFGSAVKHLLLMEGLGHFWYMPVIIKFYIILPLFLLIIGRLLKIKKGRELSLALLFITGLLFSLIFPFTKYEVNSISIKWYMPIFIMGMMLCFFFDKLNKKEQPAGDIAAIAAVFDIFLMTPPMRKILDGIEASDWLHNKYIPVGILWCLFFAGTACGRYLKKLLPGIRFFAYVGKISYELYLFHYIVLLKTMEKTESTKIIGLATLVLGFPLAIACHYMIKWVQKRLSVIKVHDHAGS